MAWRIIRWLGSTKVSEETIQTPASRQDMTRMLARLAVEHSRAAVQHPAAGEAPESGDGDAAVRSNRDGSMLWTTGKDHYTAERVSRFMNGLPIPSKIQ